MFTVLTYAAVEQTYETICAVFILIAPGTLYVCVYVCVCACFSLSAREEILFIFKVKCQWPATISDSEQAGRQISKMQQTISALNVKQFLYGSIFNGCDNKHVFFFIHIFFK